jgi:hypothetical protein
MITENLFFIGQLPAASAIGQVHVTGKSLTALLDTTRIYKSQAIRTNGLQRHGIGVADRLTIIFSRCLS